jgi:eukaryotic-like serine/threonine-protein kinase
VSRFGTPGGGSLPAFGAFRTSEQLGSGALATVYKAVQEPLGRVVAIKALKSTVGPSSPFAAQLEREARVLGELGHPNVILLYDFVKNEREMYLVLEHVDGYSLGDLVKKQEARKLRLPFEAVAAIGAQAAWGLAHVHERGVVHRDLKPHNLLVSRRGEVKLCDFGIAQRERLPSADILLTPLAADGPPSSENAAFGTPAYMSPEQILGEDVDARSDLFSLGVVLYQLLTGARPFDGPATKDKRAASQRTRRDPPPPMRTRAPDVPRALEKVTMRLLEKLPDDRYASAEEVAEALTDVVRTRTRESMASVVARALGDAGLVPAKRGAPLAPLLALAAKDNLRSSVAVLGAIGVAFAIGGAIVQLASPSRGGAAQVGAAPLPLAPEKSGALRVVATPWAEVRVDGQHVDTTPFARAIPLSPGKHWVTLAHPAAPEERREISMVTGETVLVDVTMRLDGGGS